VENAKRVGEPARFSAVKGQKGWTELANPPKPLEGGCVNELEHQGFSWVV
jgi:hypothetical protein